jgi:hypothetical protein
MLQALIKADTYLERSKGSCVNGNKFSMRLLRLPNVPRSPNCSCPICTSHNEWMCQRRMQIHWQYYNIYKRIANKKPVRYTHRDGKNWRVLTHVHRIRYFIYFCAETQIINEYKPQVRFLPIMYLPCSLSSM